MTNKVPPVPQQMPQKQAVVLQSGISGNRQINVPGQDMMQRQQQSEMQFCIKQTTKI